MMNSYKFAFAHLSLIPMYGMLPASGPILKLYTVIRYLVIIKQNNIILIQNMKKKNLATSV